MFLQNLRNKLPVKLQNVFLALSLLGIGGCVLLLWPGARSSIVSRVLNSRLTYFIEEHILHRALNPAYISYHWDNTIFLLTGTLLLFSGMVLFLVFPRFLGLGKKITKWAPVEVIIKSPPPPFFRNIWNHAAFTAAICGTLGAVFFIRTFGVVILDFTYTDWLMSGGDLSQHYTGWGLFRNSPWYFPIGLMDTITAPFKESIIYTDSIPLFAVFFKLLPSSILPDSFQYFGLFGFLAYILQGAVGGLIVKRLCGNTLYSVIGSLFFIFSPPMMARIFGHTSLAAHFIILLSVYAGITKNAPRSLKRNILIWGGLLCLSAGIHLYFVLMTGIFMVFDTLDDYIQTKKIRPLVITWAVTGTLLLVTMSVLGAFYSRADVFASYGEYNSNINAIINPLGTSSYLKDLPLAFESQYEGFAYLGLGMILALIILGVLYSKKITEIKTALADRSRYRKVKLTAGLLLVFFLFALSSVITINNHVVLKYYLPLVNTLFRIFRSTGRMMWPVIYSIMGIALWRIKKEYKPRNALVVLLMLAVIQYCDLKDFFTDKGNRFKQKTTWQTELSSGDWNTLAAKYRHIFFFDGEFEKQEKHGRLYSFLDMAIRHKLTVNDSYLARKNSVQIEGNKNDEKARIYKGEADGDTIYVFETPGDAAPFADYLHLYLLDGIAVGLKEPL
jgi:hypothetical protein